MFRSSLGIRAVAAALACASAIRAHADVVTDWNDALRDSLRTTTGVAGGPGPTSRAAAIMHVAVYDAVNSIEQTHEPYLTLLDVPDYTSPEAAAATAGYITLSMLFGDNRKLQQRFDRLYLSHLDAVPNGRGKIHGINLGVACAVAMLEHRAGDGADLPDAYEPVDEPGHWRPTFPDFTFPPFGSRWSEVTPWTMRSASQFRPPPPGGYENLSELLASDFYAKALNQVKAIGAIDSKTRTDEQTFIAHFWANDIDGTFKPPGHLNYIASVVGQQQGNTLFENARMFALLNLAMADGVIAAWDAKFATDIDLWRPITGIRLADQDGNPNTKADPDWEPLSNKPEFNGFTPPFPSYISGHSTLAGAFAGIMADFFGTDDISFTVTSDHTPGEFRTFNSFSQAGMEDAQSRVYLGVHWQFDSDSGFATGITVARHVFENFLRQVDP